MNRRLLLWRHGRTEWNVQGRVQGQSDVPLDDVGVTQAQGAAARLAALAPTRIVSSDLLRARATAEALGELTGLEVELDERLREMNFGVREGLTIKEAWRKYPELMRSWGSSPEVRIPAGETYAETGARFASSLRRLVATMAPDEAAVVVSHGAALRTGICTFLGLPQDLWTTFGGFSNCSWTTLDESRRGWRITEWNAGTLPEPILSDDQ